MKIEVLKYYNDSENGYVKPKQVIDVTAFHGKQLIELGYGKEAKKEEIKIKEPVAPKEDKGEK